jgi:hypothetical protein
MTVQRELIRDLGQSINALNSNFFSSENMTAIQVSIQKNVYNFSKEKFRIDRQSDQEVGITMREVYRQYAQYPQIDTVQNLQIEIQRLNDILVEKAVVSVIKNIRVHQKYMSDRERGYALQDRPMTVTMAGSRLNDPHSIRNTNNIGGSIDRGSSPDFSHLPW